MSIHCLTFILVDYSIDETKEGMNMIRCKPYRVNDEMFCDGCAKSWDVNDLAPECTEEDQQIRRMNNKQERKRVGREVIKKLKRGLS